ncbi:hypothetical protein [Streptomyces sp. NPDC057702]
MSHTIAHTSTGPVVVPARPGGDPGTAWGDRPDGIRREARAPAE